MRVSRPTPKPYDPIPLFRSQNMVGMIVSLSVPRGSSEPYFPDRTMLYRLGRICIFLLPVVLIYTYMIVVVITFKWELLLNHTYRVLNAMTTKNVKLTYKHFKRFYNISYSNFILNHQTFRQIPLLLFGC